MSALKFENSQVNLNQPFVEELKKTGLLRLNEIYTKEMIQDWNEKLNPLLKEREAEAKSYIKLDELDQLGILDSFFNARMRGVIQALMPDPTLLCFHVYETEKSDKPHVFGDTFSGWHRDVNDLPGIVANDPNFLSIFVYLSDVGEDSGPFEIIPKSFTGPLNTGMESVKVLGGPGETFVWNRTMFHRANPNQSTVRRRVLKISLQHNYLQNEHIDSELFQKVRDKYAGKDDYLHYLCGGVHKYSPCGEVPDSFVSDEIAYTPFQSNSKVKIKFFQYLKSVFWYFKRAKKMFGP